jgi:hypothetical protein
LGLVKISQGVFPRQWISWLLKTAVMMNMIYLNTETGNDLKEIFVRARTYLLKKTIEFIDILNPINVVLLTSSKSILSLFTVTNLEVLGSNIKKESSKIVMYIPFLTIVSNN